MASQNAYTVTLQAQLDTKSLQAQVNKIKLNVGGSSGTTQATKNFGNITKSITATSKASESLSSNIQQNIGKVLQWALATGAIYGTLAKIKDGVKYISDLNKEMTDTRIVTGMTAIEAENLAGKYSRLAQQMGATTLEVANGSLEWFRQGKTVEEAMALTTKSIMLAKLANMDTAQSTEYLTSIINGFKLEAQDVSLVIDKLVGLDNAYATSVAEIASAMQRSSNSAMQAGVTFDELASYITVLSSVTRKSSESIGESFKTMFARMQNIKLGKYFEDDTTTLNDVEEALTRIAHVALRDTTESFRPLGDVIDDVGKKWNTLNTIEQSAVANAIAGVRQRENFLVLMSNYDQVLKAQTIASESAGLAAQRYGIYLDGLEASLNRAKSAWEGVWQSTINSDFIKWLIDASAATANLIENLGGLVPVLGVILGLLIAIKATAITAAIVSFIDTLFIGIVSLVSVLETGTAAWTLFGTAGTIATGGLLPLVGIIIAATAAFVGFMNTIPTAKENLDAINDSIATTKEELGALNDKKQYLGNMLEELNNFNTMKDGLTSDQEARYFEIMSKIHEMMPSLAYGYDTQGRLYLTNASDLSVLNDELETNIRLKKEQLAGQQADAINAALILANNLTKDLDITTDTQAPMMGWISLGETLETVGEITDENRADLEQYASDIAAAFGNTTEKVQANTMAQLETMGAFGQMTIEKILAIQNAITSAPTLQTDEQAAAAEVEAARLEALKLRAEELSAQMTSLTSAYSILTSAMREMDAEGNISNGTAFQLMASHASLIPYLTKTAEGFRLDAEGARMALREEMILTFAQYGLRDAAFAAAQGNYALAISAINASKALAEEKAEMLGLLQAFASMASVTIPTGGGGGSGGGGSGSSGNANQKQIDELNERKKALQKLLDEYKKYIKTQKELLKLQKEEADFTKDLGRKNKDLAELKRELAIISMDTSEEGMRRRMELEDEIAKLSYEIDEDLADRKYDLQVASWDKLQELMEDSIGKQIEAIDDLIDALTKAGMSTGSLGEGFTAMGGVAKTALEQVIDSLILQGIYISGANGYVRDLIQSMLDLGMPVEEVTGIVAALYNQILNSPEPEIQGMIGQWKNMGYTVDEAIGRVINLFDTVINNPSDSLAEMITSWENQGFSVDEIRTKVIDFYGKVIDTPDITTMIQQWKTLGLTEDEIQGKLIDYYTKVMDTPEIQTLIDDFIDAGGKVGDLSTGWGAVVSQIQAAIDRMREYNEEQGKGGGGGGGCFTAGTMIAMADGNLVAIEDVRVGDFVFSHDVVTNEMIPAEVNKTFIHPKETVVGYLIINENLCVTPEHTVCVNELWKPAGDVEVGELFTVFNNERELITSIEWVSKGVPVYNLGTSHESHNYFANGYLVHNAQQKYHSGGFVESHHAGDFAGGLKSNEVYAKLLQGEYVATEPQMNRFMKNTLPNLISKGSAIRQRNSGDVNIKMPIQVMGNLDRDALPAFEKMVEKSFKKMTKTMNQRGYKRTTDNFSS